MTVHELIANGTMAMSIARAHPAGIVFSSFLLSHAHPWGVGSFAPNSNDQT